MSDSKSLTKSELITTLKEIGVATKDDLRQLRGGLEEKIDKLERSLKRRMGVERNKILTTVGRLATTTPTLTAFRELKSKVEHVQLTS